MGKAQMLKKARRVFRNEFDKQIREIGTWPLRDRLRIAWWIVRGRPKIIFRRD